ncbi:hypothetical protein [Stenotrophomonas phage SB5]|uniref:Tail fiber protein n=1 Tax=Stenotrophomonas phage SB5 TaxID=3117469 RepID=A0ABZ2GZV6_9CAUD
MIPAPVSGIDPSTYVLPSRRFTAPLVDYAMGSSAVGLSAKRNTLWTSSYDGANIQATPEGGSAVTLLTVPNVTRVAFDFDQLMRPVVGYQTGGSSAFLWWYDSSVGSMVTVEYAGYKDICVNLDVWETESQALSDVLVSAVKNSSQVVCRVQRERMLTEHVLLSGLVAESKLLNVGMANNRRLQWKVYPKL